MRKSWLAIFGVAAFAAVGARGEALAAPQGTSARPAAAAMSEFSSQTRRRPRTRIVVYPRIDVYPRLIGPPRFGFSRYPRPYPYDWPGPYGRRECVGWLAAEARPSGPVVVPHRRCWWVPG